MRFSLRQLPNCISALRILLVVPIAVTLSRSQFVQTLWLFAVAAASDAADGFIAKRFGWQTRLGAVLDPIADKLMLAAVFLTLAWMRLAPLWLMATALLRDLVIVVGAIAYRVRFGRIEMQPSAISKFNTLCQIVFVLALIAKAQFDWPAEPVIIALGALAFVTTVISGIDYVLVWARRAVVASSARHTDARHAGAGSR